MSANAEVDKAVTDARVAIQRLHDNGGLNGDEDTTVVAALDALVAYVDELEGQLTPP